MKIIVDKYSRFLFKIFLIGLVLAIVYLLIPKYQVEMVRVDNETVMITKINILTGKTETYYQRTRPFTTQDIYDKLGL